MLFAGTDTTSISHVAVALPALAVILAFPNSFPVITPFLSTVAISVSLDSQTIGVSAALSGVTVAVRVFCILY